jgi:peptide deformylase
MIRTILMLGEPTLFEASHNVTQVTAPAVSRLAQDMRDTLEAANAIAIAAPQIGSLDRVIVFQLPEDRIPKGSNQAPISWTAMVNPELEMLTEAEQSIYERCLSIPGYYARIPRCARVRMRYTDLDGQKQEIVGSGYLAALLQHEYDHLDGVLYPMRMRSGREMVAVSTVCGPGALYRYSVDEFDGDKV